MSKLVIVESPAKSKTIKKYLGRGYEVMASMGHLRDLPKSTLGVDIENDFTPKYINVRKQSALIKELVKKAKKADKVYLATDPDREGEAISWHLSHILGLDINDANRVSFNEITKTGIVKGMKNPRKIDIDLFHSQQARRILDRIVGYKLSPFLWRKVASGLSAGRVQSVAVRIIVDRENEINAFIPKEYWSIDALLSAKTKKQFAAKFYGKDGKKLEIEDEKTTNDILAGIKGKDFVVDKVKKGTKKRSPAPPFITSTLQQDASRKLNFQTHRTMRAAQQLYEGVPTEEYGEIGLITYMRTDSLRISDEARAEAAEYITQVYGKEYLPANPNVYRSKSGAQDAHEAIRPTMPSLSPDRVKAGLTADQYKVYKLIWERFIASQMTVAEMNTVQAEIKAADYNFRASGSTIKFAGFLVLYEEGKDVKEDDPKELPVLTEGEILKLHKLEGNQHFTEPPPRYTEATLIKMLEEKGIGRPSTYSPVISTITQKNYVEREGKALKPTTLGEVTTTLMKEHFDTVIDITFTAGMENQLDLVEAGEQKWVDVLREFYGGFDTLLQNAEKAMEGVFMKIPDEETDEVCEKCGKPIVIKMGRFGKFKACTGFPECKNAKPLADPTEGKCPVCGGMIYQKKSKRGKVYFSCENFKECKFWIWDTPIKDLCPSCSSTMFKKGGKNAKTYCAKQDCGYEVNE
ncbi:MAG: type I DNA topoisomerase [Oscillospiraceae bacterium]|nr:type I DNA topoisomerase [Oscillospiraceae bacterium]